eukprot:scaffold9037_cov134-Skeletonema_dohrnii-CCMP3373.AAC.2
MGRHAQETCKSVGPNGGLPLLSFVRDPGRSGDHLNNATQGHGGEKARWNDNSSYFVGRWRLDSAAHQLCPEDRRTLLTALAMSKQ